MMKTIRFLVLVALVGAAAFGIYTWLKSPEGQDPLGSAGDALGGALDATQDTIGGLGGDLKEKQHDILK